MWVLQGVAMAAVGAVISGLFWWVVSSLMGATAGVIAALLVAPIYAWWLFWKARGDQKMTNSAWIGFAMHIAVMLAVILPRVSI